ncbi:type II toxin-antitoxin system Phd/YefM family antitoxin [Candidatus Peregrinibacteria bacterium]|nr:type II toxin-antitoxin system Phd/YefM family antitoxin [Candidatus Peregrinibacteria bacterium]
MKRWMTATEARKNFYAVVVATKHPGISVAITHRGIPTVVAMSSEEFERWQGAMKK